MIAYNNRVLVCGKTRSGKSELLNMLASQLRNQWALVDPKGEFEIPGVERLHDVEQLDFANERILHWVPPADLAQWELFFARVNALKHAKPPGRFTAIVHEAGFSCGFRPNATGVEHNTFLSQGEAWGLGGLYATQRPALLPTFATSEPAVTIAMAEKMARDDDHKTLAAAMSMPPRQLADAQAHLLAIHGKHAYVVFDRDTGSVTGMAPLPAQLLRQNIVRRVTVE